MGEFQGRQLTAHPVVPDALFEACAVRWIHAGARPADSRWSSTSTWPAIRQSSSHWIFSIRCIQLRVNGDRELGHQGTACRHRLMLVRADPGAWGDCAMAAAEGLKGDIQYRIWAGVKDALLVDEVRPDDCSIDDLAAMPERTVAWYGAQLPGAKLRDESDDGRRPASLLSFELSQTGHRGHCQGGEPAYRTRPSLIRRAVSTIPPHRAKSRAGSMGRCAS